ncbi:epoxyqueuosine reductase QueH [Candidatus Roizmanbacteria bacterium]|nr:epoxyqueuosine reductase QueH [Candidatus Roizmanbacteria bacterium]
MKELKQKISTANLFDQRIRCPQCWSLRLSAAFRYAKEHGFSQLTTTLLSSTYQNREAIIGLGNKFSTEFGVDFYVPKTIVCDLPTGGFYKQNYCGCVYSLVNRMEEKYYNEEYEKT